MPKMIIQIVVLCPLDPYPLYVQSSRHLVIFPQSVSYMLRGGQDRETRVVCHSD